MTGFALRRGFYSSEPEHRHVFESYEDAQRFFEKNMNFEMDCPTAVMPDYRLSFVVFRMDDRFYLAIVTRRAIIEGDLEMPRHDVSLGAYDVGELPNLFNYFCAAVDDERVNIGLDRTGSISDLTIGNLGILRNGRRLQPKIDVSDLV